jgi:hypothetical protein
LRSGSPSTKKHDLDAPKSLGNLATACGGSPDLRHWHYEGDLLCWTCWQRVKHLRHGAGDAMESCRLYRSGHADSPAPKAHDELAALGPLDYD